ncbi:M35 family metallo-endopeptidase [Streptomyces sp. NPDC002446]
MNEDFRIYLRTEQPRYRLAEPVLITCELTNVSDRDYRLLDWNSPFESGEVFHYFTVRRDEERVPYDGRCVKRGEPEESSYRLIRAGESLAATDDLTTAYPITAPGTYTVTLDARILDAFVVEPGAPLVRQREEHHGFQLDPISVTFEVVGEGEPRITVAERVRRELGGPQAPSASLAVAKLAPRTPVLIGGTLAEREAVLRAHENAGVFSESSMHQLMWVAGVANAHSKEWFGAHDAGRYATVQQHYVDISGVVAGQTVTYDLTGTGCQPGWYAYTYKNTRKIWLCSGFWSAAATGTDSKFGTVVHELSHAVCSTDDLAYGEAGARNLASTKPPDAIRNADNHEYFTEHLAAKVITAPILVKNGKAHMFVAGNLFQVDIALSKAELGPVPLTSKWSGVFPDRVDACVEWPSTKDVYFFRGSEYVRFDRASSAVAPGYPLAIDAPAPAGWRGVFPDGIDACLMWPGGKKIYFFRGSQYSRYDIDESGEDGAVGPGYPLPITEGWPGIWPADLTGAVTWVDGNVYFFRGSEYMTYRIADDVVAGPKPISSKWQGLP